MVLRRKSKEYRQEPEKIELFRILSKTAQYME